MTTLIHERVPLFDWPTLSVACKLSTASAGQAVPNDRSTSPLPDRSSGTSIGQSRDRTCDPAITPERRHCDVIDAKVTQQYVHAI
ncbi:MAG: hypothetical protein KDA86_23525 [Planctomycetaceae bacterium]|nr:hypothetical protein [Planctomycetaceae bacterium]